MNQVAWWRSFSVRTLFFVSLLVILLVAGVATSIITSRSVNDIVKVKMGASIRALVDVEHMRDGFATWNRKLVTWGLLEEEVLADTKSHKPIPSSVSSTLSAMQGDIPNQYSFMIGALNDMKSFITDKSSLATLNQFDQAILAYKAQYVTPMQQTPTNATITALAAMGQPVVNNMGGYLDTLLQTEQNNTAKHQQTINSSFQQSETIDYVFLIVGIIVTILSYFFVIAAVRTIKVLVNYVRRVGQNDFSFDTIPIKNKNEFGLLGATLMISVANLKRVLLQIQEYAGQLAASSEQLNLQAYETGKASESIAVTMNEVAHETEELVKVIEESSSTIQSISSSIQVISQNTEQSTKSSSTASSIAKEGGTSIQSAVSEMSSITQTVEGLNQSVNYLGVRSDEIRNIVNVITEISEQTNLLSLNAAIEAARAGEQGKGFAVVANEVRMLAERSSVSANEIAKLVNTIQTDLQNVISATAMTKSTIDHGIQAVKVAGDSFYKIIDSVDVVTKQIDAMNVKAKEIAGGSAEVTTSIQQMTSFSKQTSSGTETVAATTQEQLAAMEEISASSQSLSKLAEELKDIVVQFTL